MGNISSRNLAADHVESIALSHMFNDSFIESSLVSLQRMSERVDEGLTKKEIWNGNLIQSIISNAESYLKNQLIFILLLGASKVGKTTMLNSLIGCDLIPFSFHSATPQSTIIISIGYHSHSKVSVKQCDPSSFLPLEEDQPNESSQQYLNINEVGPFINKQVGKVSSNSTLPSVQAANNHSVKVFEVLINAEIFDQYPSEIKKNIRLIDTPGLTLNNNDLSHQSVSFLNCIKSISKDGSPIIKFYVWVTSLCAQNIRSEKKLFESTCIQLHLRDKHNGDRQFFNNSTRQLINNQDEMKKQDVLESICNVIRFSSSLSENNSNSLLESIDPIGKRTISDFVHSEDSQRIEPLRFLELHQQSQDEEEEKPSCRMSNDEKGSDTDDDFQVIDEEQIRQDSEELRLRYETIPNLRLMKFKRQLIVIVNQQDDRSLLLQGTQFFTKSMVQLPTEKFLSHLENVLEKNAIQVWPLAALLSRKLRLGGCGNSQAGSSAVETEIMGKFNSDYKDVFRSLKEEIVFLSRDESERDLLIELSGFKYFERQLSRSIKELLDYKNMKRRRRIQEVIDKSCSFSSKIILNQAKKSELDKFILETLPIFHSNHQLFIQNSLHNLHSASVGSRAAIVSAINQVHQSHKSYSLFDKVEVQLNSLILEYLRDSVQSLANAMDKGDQIIESNKDMILNELKQIDPQLQEGIKSIITDFKKRSMQRANHAITTNMCLSLQQNFSVLSKVLSTSSIITGISVLLQRIAGKSLIGSGPTGLAVAVGMTAVSTVWYVNEREKKLKEGQTQILQYLEGLEAGQEKIHLQLVQSYTEVYKEVIDVIQDYLNGIASTTFEQLISEQSLLRKQDCDIEVAGNLKPHKHRGFSEGTLSSSSGGDSDSERSEELSDFASPLTSVHQIQEHSLRNFERKCNSQKQVNDENTGDQESQNDNLNDQKTEEHEEIFYSFHEQNNESFDDLGLNK